MLVCFHFPFTTSGVEVHVPLHSQSLLFSVDEKGEWSVEKTLAGHSDYVRDVAWCPVISHSVYTIASCGMVILAKMCSVNYNRILLILEDQAVILWRCNENGEWTAKLLEKVVFSVFILGR